MKRKKAKAHLTTIALSLIAVLTTQAKAETTYYEVWRNTEDELTTAQPIIQWHENSSTGVIEHFDDKDVQANHFYYYWVRSFKGNNDAYCSHDYEHDEHSNAWIRMWYATEADKNNIYLSGEINWPFKVELGIRTHYERIAGPQGYTVNINSSVYEDNNPLSDVLLGNWITNDNTDDVWYIKDYEEETQYVDLKDKAGSETIAEVYAKCRIDWPVGGNNIPMIFETSNVNVTFVDLENGPVVSAIGEPNGIRLRWNATPLKTTMFSQRVSCRLSRNIYVSISSNVYEPNGTSWEDAYEHLQDALAIARYNDEIRVRVPVFGYDPYLSDKTMNNPGGTGQRTETFVIPDGVRLIGGYSGNGLERDPEEYQCILSGDVGSFGTETDNSYHVVTISGCDANTVLDGFVVESGYSDGSIPNDRGAGIYITNSDAVIKNCIIAGNSGLMGTGVYCKQSNPAIINCLFWGNYSEKWGGAGLYNEDSNTTVLNSKFILNKTDISIMGLGGNGGAIYNERSNILMTNCELKCNTAKRDGGGIYNYDSMPKLTNCTLSGNIADVNGGGIFEGYNSSTEIKNSILWNNGDPEPLNEYSQIHTEAASPVIFHSCIQDEIAGDGTLAFDSTNGNNIDLNPLFINDPNPGLDGQWNGVDDCVGNLKLQYNSPCIEVGNNSYLPADSFDLDNDSNITEPVPVDLADHLRLIDRNGDFTATVDMGAYERGACPGNPDLDGSGFVNLADFAVFAAKWLNDDCDCHGSCCNGADLNSDENVDVEDLGILTNHWLTDPDALFADDFEQGKSQEWLDILPRTWTDSGWLYAEREPGSSYLDSVAVIHDCDGNWNNYRLSVTVDSMEKWAIVCFRTNNSGTPTDGDGMAFDGYRLDICQGEGSYTNKLTLTRHQGEPINTVFLKNSPENIVPSSSFQLDIEMIGADIKVYIDSSLAMEYTDENPIHSGGIGLGCIWSLKVRFDDVVVTKIEGFSQ